MATLQKIRNNAGLFVSIFIGFALLAFILGDLLRSGDSIMNKSRQQVAEINGESVSIMEYQAMVDQTIESHKKNTGTSALDEATIDRLREQTWEQLLNEYIMTSEYEELSIGVSGSELFDMVQGNNIDPQVLQIPIFKNQQTGLFDRSLVVRFLKEMELDPSGQAKSSWTAFENALVAQKKITKYNTLIAKGMYVTSVHAKNEAKNKLKQVDFEYVKAPFVSISDSAITVSQSEIDDYYSEHEDEFQQEEAREIIYLSYPIFPSQDDIKGTEELVADLKDEFSSVENSEQYVNLNSDIPYRDKFYGVDELNVNIMSLYESEAGTVVGPYRDGDYFKISKAVEFDFVPDSAKARHILLRSESMPYAIAKSTADSLLNLLKNGADFAELAKENSQDATANGGGDLGWFKEGMMVKPFNDACFLGKKGDLTIVESQFGVHIVEVTGQASKSKKVKVATIARKVEPSQKTFQNIYAEASKFGGTNRTNDDFKINAEKDNLTIRYATLKRNDKNLSGIENSRQIVKWAFEAENKSVSEIFELDDNYIIASVSNVIEEGTTPLASVRNIVERKVRAEKKADMLAEKLKEASSNSSTLQQIAEKMNTSVMSAEGVSLTAYSVPALGSEPQVQGYALNMAENKISEPVKGNTGVFVIKVNNISEAPENINGNSEKETLNMVLQRKVAYQLYDAIKEAKDIKDYRYKFY